MPHELSDKQQRAALLEQLNNPSLIIADEPTGNLDPKSIEIVNLLKKININGSSVISNSDYDIIKSHWEQYMNAAIKIEKIDNLS